MQVVALHVHGTLDVTVWRMAGRDCGAEVREFLAPQGAIVQRVLEAGMSERLVTNLHGPVK